MMIGKATICRNVSKIMDESSNKYRCQFALSEKLLNFKDINLIPDTIIADNKMVIAIKVYGLAKKLKNSELLSFTIKGRALTKIALAGTGSP